MILDKEFPPDERVEKEAISLIENGHFITLLCLTYGNENSFEEYHGINIYRIYINKKLRNKIAATYLIFPFYRWFWKKHINDIIKNHSIQAIHVHDLPLTDIAVKIKTQNNIKLICDQHEYYSNWINKTAHYNTKIGKVVKLLSNWRKYEKENLSKADLVITVEEPLKECYISEVKICQSKIISLPNTPLLKYFTQNNIDNSITEKYKDNFNIFYAGGIDILRGISTILKSLELLYNKIPEIKFIMAGKIIKPFDLFDEIHKLKIEPYVDFVGWIPLNILPSYIAASNICIHVPPATHDEVNKTIATKIYQYAAMNKFIIVGQAKMMKEFVTNNRLGVAIKESDHNDLANKILEYYNNYKTSSLYLDTKQVSANYFWESSVKVLIDAYNNL